MPAIVLLLFLRSGSLFTVDASASVTYEVAIPRQELGTYLDDIGLFARNMPGVVAVEPIGTQRYLYRTERSIPLSTPMRTDFEVCRATEGDSLTIYRSTNDQSSNYMECRVLIRPEGASQTSIGIHLRVRLIREHASDIHWLAPLLGETLISRQMSLDLEDMLHEFVNRSTQELYTHLRPEQEQSDK